MSIGSVETIPTNNRSSPSSTINNLRLDTDVTSAAHAQIDTGADTTCTNLLYLLHRYKPFSPSNPCPLHLRPAKKGATITPLGAGYLRVPAPTILGYKDVYTFYSPDLNTTVISDNSLIRSTGNPSAYSGVTLEQFFDAGTCTFTAHHRLRRSEDLVIYGVYKCGNSYTQALIPPPLPPDHPKAHLYSSSAPHPSPLPPDPGFLDRHDAMIQQRLQEMEDEQLNILMEELRTVPRQYHSIDFKHLIHSNVHSPLSINKLRVDTEKLLWHQRLGHCSDEYLCNAHKFVDGVPKFNRSDSTLHQCPTCIQAKMTKSPAGPNTTMTATVPYQGLSVDFSFTGLRSKNADRAVEFTGLHGETCWLLITDHFSHRLHGITRLSKGSPIDWLDNWLKDHSPNMPGKYVYLDQGGELFKNPAVVKLFEKHKYQIRPTGADASHQNGPVERAHYTVANAIRAMLLGAGLDAKFWPYAFHHYIRIKNALGSSRMSKSPTEIATGKKDNFSGFRTFGCRVWVRPPGRRSSKLKPNARKGIFLGFLPSTTRNITWFDPETDRVKIATHVRFDEGMNDIPMDATPPNVQHLQRSELGERFPSESQETSVDKFHFRLDPFTVTLNKDLTVSCDDPTFGLEIARDITNNRAFIADIKDRSSGSKLCSSHKATRRKLKGAFIVSIDNKPIFTKDDALSALRELKSKKAPKFSITFAPERYATASQLRKALTEHNILLPDDPDAETTPDITPADIRAIASLRHGIDTSSIPIEDMTVMLHALQSDSITPAEQALGHFTRRKLKTLDTWPQWQAGEQTQLDHFEKLNMYGKPVSPPPGAIILRSHWQYRVKTNGTRRSRNCCDGSPRAAPILHALAQTYASCVEQPIQRLFFALSASLGHRLYGGDAQDAYAHSPPPSVPTFVHIDDQYADWYYNKYKVKLDRSKVLPVNHALQGHPESGRLWDEHINKILASDQLGFKSTTHDKTIYQTSFKGQRVLLLRQVDDFAISCTHESTAKEIFSIIGKLLQLPGEPDPPFKYLGLLTEFNGVTITQTRSSVTISCPNYILRLLKAHQWDTPSHDEPSSKPGEPLPPSCLNELYTSEGPLEGTTAHAKLAKEQGFSYRTLLGELLYAYVTCRPDIGYAIVMLSKFASAPAPIHYQRLKGVAKYIRRTSSWGIKYWKPNPDKSLPPDNEDLPEPLPEDHPPFPSPSSPFTLTGFVDAAHGNDLRTRRSTTGYAFTLAGGAIAYRSKTQSLTATSSCEAEFYAAVTAAKVAKYLRSILLELGFPQKSPTLLHEDNASTIKLINAKQPTERSRHVDIQFFAIQDWNSQGHILMVHTIPGIINPSDNLTKPLGWVLHSRHMLAASWVISPLLGAPGPLAPAH